MYCCEHEGCSRPRTHTVYIVSAREAQWLPPWDDTETQRDVCDEHLAHWTLDPNLYEEIVPAAP